jgi:hypothetical protein
VRTLYLSGALIVLAGAVPFAHPRPALQDIPDLTHLEVCNQGDETVYAFNASKAGTIAWMKIEPGGCDNVYAQAAPGVDPAYIGFALKNRDGRLVSVPSNVPNAGTNANGVPLFRSASTAFCAHPYPEDFSLFTSDGNSGAHCDDYVSKKISDPVHRRYAAYSSSVYFSPSLDCSVLGSCQGNSYQLDVNVAADRGRITLVRPPTPMEIGMKFLAQMLVAYEKAKVDSEQQQLAELQNRFARFKAGSAMSWQEQWEKAPQISAAQYDSSLMTSTVIVRGVIDHYRVDTRRFPQWITIFFRDAPGGPFVVCSPYPDMFQEVVGLNLNALVGKTLEVVGPVEGVMCSADPGGPPLTGSIRVVESGMFHIK